MSSEIINPKSLGEPRGWSNGILSPAGSRLLFVAGQAGYSEGADRDPPHLAEQFVTALDKVLTVVREAGGEPTDIARLTVYVTNLASYRDSRKRLREAWRERFGNYYPAMALLEVSGLVDRGAQVEIEATVAIGGKS